MLTTNLVRHLPIVALICAISLCGEASAKGAELSCIDENGNPVDWYIGYKFPKIIGNNEFQSGYSYAYITSNDMAEPVNHDIQTERKVDDGDSLAFLRQFKDLLVKFGGSFTRRSSTTAKPGSKKTRARKAQDTKDINSKWVASEKRIDDPESPLMRTLAPAYDEKLFNTISSIYYNDDPENTEAESRDDSSESDSSDSGSERVWTKKNIPSRVAHAKGVLLMEEESNSGIWLTHSIPKFPNVRDHILDYAETAVKFGQTFMCITFDLKKTGGKLIDHLANMRPLVYDRQLTPSLLKEFPNLDELDLYRNIRYKRQSNPTKLAQTIVTKGGQVMKLYSKPPTVLQDMYSGWLDHDLGADLYVETWRRGSGGVLDSSCPKQDYHINNVKDLKYSEALTWEYLVDHSKWAISDDKDIATVCISDSNRMQSQFKRGSGAVCIKCPTCWSIFSNTILDTEPCPLKVNKTTRGQLNIDESLAIRIEKYLNATKQ